MYLRKLKELSRILEYKKLIPKLPQSWECCGDSCPNCVWDLYFEELKKFNKFKKTLKLYKQYPPQTGC